MITLRAGYTTALGDGSLAGAGLSIGPLDLGLARWQAAGAGELRRGGWVGGLGLNFRTRATLVD